MKTREQIALEVANTSFVDRRNNIMPTRTFMGNDDELLTFTKRLIEAWLEQQSQEPVAYMAPSGTCVTAEDVSYTPNWTDYYTIPLYAAPPAKVDQQSQEPVAWYSHSGTLAHDKKSFPPSTQHLAKPLFLAPPPAKTFIRERAQLEQEWLNLRQLTEASKAKPPATPEGYVLVPKEPTEAMILAARQSHEEEAYLPYSVYKSMIEAAQGGKP